jgi:hypothetical protein
MFRYKITKNIPSSTAITVSSVRGIHKLIEKVRVYWIISWTINLKKKHQTLTEEELDETEARLENTPQKFQRI